MLRCLPKQLRTRDLMEKHLAANNLDKMITAVRVWELKEGKSWFAKLQVSSVDQVSTVAKFFHGKTLGASRPIGVSFSSGGMLEPAKLGASKPGGTKIFLHDPCRIEGAALDLDFGSQASTGSASSVTSEDEPWRVETAIPLPREDSSMSLWAAPYDMVPMMIPAYEALPPGLAPPGLGHWTQMVLSQ